MIELYKWQHQDYRALASLLSHPSQALLVSASPGLGQDVLIQNYILLLMCETPQLINNISYPCNRCQSCFLFAANNHPDFYHLVTDPDANRKNISIGDIRGMLDFLSTTTHLGRYKVVLIPDIDLLSINSANALLKILEEPPSYVLFIMQTTNISGVLPTIRSRCHVHKLFKVSKSDAFEHIEKLDIFNPEFWCAYYDNAPLFEPPVSKEQFDAILGALLQPSIENIFIASSEFDAKNAGFLIGFLSRWLGDLVSYLQGSPMRYFMAYSPTIETLSKRIDLQKIYYLFDQVNFLEDWALHPLNYKLQLENLLLQYQNLFVKR